MAKKTAKKPKKSSHKKPTQKDIEKTLEEAEELKEEEPIPEEVEEAPEEIPEEAEEPKEPEPEIDYKKKFSESSREAQKINAKNKKINEAIDKAGEIDVPSDSDMEKEYPDWEIMDDTQKKLAREVVIGRKFRENLAKAREEGKKIEKWNESVDKFVEDPDNLNKYPGLEGRLDDFKVYAADESRTSIPFDVLVPAFLHSSTKPDKKKGSMFPKGTPGPTEVREDNRLTLEEGRKLRETDYNKWKEYVRAGKIKTDL